MEKTQKLETKLVRLLDNDRSPLDNYRTMVAFIKSLPLNDRVEMMLTLRAFINEEFRGN